MKRQCPVCQTTGEADGGGGGTNSDWGGGGGLGTVATIVALPPGCTIIVWGGGEAHADSASTTKAGAIANVRKDRIVKSGLISMLP